MAELLLERRVLVLALVAALAASCSERSQSCPAAGSLEVDAQLVPAGEEVTIELHSDIQGCPGTWSLTRAPEGSLAALVGTSDETATFSSTTAGDYEIALSRSGHQFTIQVTVFSPVLPVTVSSPVPTAQECYDLEGTSDGHLLCVAAGVRLVDPDTGATLASTAESSPLLWGLAAHGMRFATASSGCSQCSAACCADDSCSNPLECLGCCRYEVEAQASLYEVGQGQIGPRTQLLAAPANELSLTETHLAVTTSNQTFLFDLSDAGTPRLLGCKWAPGSSPLFGYPLIVEDRVYAWWDETLTAHRLADFVHDCDAAGRDAAGTLELPDHGRPAGPFRGAPLLLPYGFWLYAPGEDRISVIDARDLGSPSKVSELPLLRLTDAAIFQDKLVAATDDRLIVFDLASPGAPAPVGQWRADRRRSHASARSCRVAAVHGRRGGISEIQLE